MVEVLSLVEWALSAGVGLIRGASTGMSVTIGRDSSDLEQLKLVHYLNIDIIRNIADTSFLEKAMAGCIEVLKEGSSILLLLSSAYQSLSTTHFLKVSSFLCCLKHFLFPQNVHYEELTSVLRQYQPVTTLIDF